MTRTYRPGDLVASIYTGHVGRITHITEDRAGTLLHVTVDGKPSSMDAAHVRFIPPLVGDPDDPPTPEDLEAWSDPAFDAEPPDEDGPEDQTAAKVMAVAQGYNDLLDRGRADPDPVAHFDLSWRDR